ncbi:MAG: hypothetical protein Q8M23_08995, partial [Bacteroidales bacterium]|nr:hypothetical protein [Bacteroidales bacterium]
SNKVPVLWEETPTHHQRFNYRYYEKGAWKEGFIPFLKHLKRFLTDRDNRLQQQNILALLVLLVLLVYFTVISFLSEGTYGGGDDLHHYRFARYAFRYPHFLLDHWGKPLFTVLNAPFAQAGYNGARLYNVLAAMFTAFFTFKLMQARQQKNAVLIIFFVLFAPVFMSLIPSVMTEITGSLCLVLAVFLYFRKNYAWAAFVISFIPMARTEGFLIIPLFLFMLAMRRQWKALPLLLAGSVIFSLAGWKHYGDLFWIITKIPYGSFSADIYGSGNLFFYVNPDGLKMIIGFPLAVLFVIGILRHFYELIKSRFSLKTYHFDEFILIFLPVIIVLVFHSLAWYLGTGALALHRFMVLVIPLAVFFSLKGFNWLEKLLSFNIRAIQLVLSLLVVVLVIRTTVATYRFPVPLSSPAILVKEACDWIEDNDLNRKKIYYFDPNVFFFLDIDPHDENKIHCEVYDVHDPGVRIEPGSVLIWDAHFGPNEGRLPLERLTGSSDFIELRRFEPQYPFQVLGGYYYAVYVFQRI